MIGFLLVPIGLAVWLFLAAYEGKFGLSLDRHVRISDSFTVICTTILALALQYFFARRNTYERDRRETASDAIKTLLASLQDLRQWVSDAITGNVLTTEQAQKIIFGFDCCFDALIMLELAFEDPNPDYLSDRVGDLTGKVLECKSQLTGGDFPKRVMTYADVESLSILRRDIARKLSPLQRTGPNAETFISRQWRQFKAAVERDSANLWD